MIQQRDSARSREGWYPWVRRRWRQFWRQYERVILTSLWAVSLGLGMWGFADYLKASGEEPRLTQLLYLSFQLFTLESGAVTGPGVGVPLEIARFLAPGVAAWTLLEAIGAVFVDQVQRVRARTLRNHAVICGLGRKGSLLARALVNRGMQVIAIEKDPNGAYVSQSREQGVIVLIGDAATPALLRQARIHEAARVLAVCTPDSVNLDVAFQVRSLVNHDRKRPLSCTVHVAEPYLWGVLREQGLGVAADEAFVPRIVNLYDDAASVLLSEYPAFDDAAKPEQPPHLLLVGLGRFGESLLLRAARLWQVRPKPGNARLRVTIVDREADRLWALLRLRSPELEHECDVEAVPLDVYSPEFHAGQYLCDSEGRCTCTVAYVCLENDAVGLDASIALLRAMRDSTSPIVVRIREENGVARLFTDRAEGHALRRVYPFPLLDRALTSTLLDGSNELLPLLMHAAYRKYQAIVGHLASDDPSMLPWHELSEDLRVSNRRRVEQMIANLRTIGCQIVPTDDWEDWEAAPIAFTADEVETLARLEHERWRQERISQGWVLDADRAQRQNPLLVGWEKLQPDVQAYSRNDIRALPTALAGAGFRIERIARPAASR